MNNDSLAGFADNSQLLESQQSGVNHLLHETYEALSEGGRAFTHSAFIAPMEGLHQTFEHLGLADKPQTNPEILPPQQFGSGRWLAQQIGGALGFAIPFCIFAAGLRAGTGALKLGIGALAKSQGVDLGLNYAFRAVQSSLTRTGVSSLEASAAGFGYDMLCKPIAPEKNNFWDERFRHGLSSAATFGFMHAASDALKRLDIERLSKTPWLVDTFGNDLQRQALAGLSGGAVDSLVRTNLTEHRAPTTGEMVESMLTFSVIGSAMRTNSELFSRARGTSSLSDVVANDSRLQAQVRGNEDLSWLMARIGNERVCSKNTASMRELLRQTNPFKQFGNRDISNNLIKFVANRTELFEALGEKASVESDMNLFEQRMRQQNPARGLNSIGSTYKQVLSILDAKGSIFAEPERQTLAEQALYLSSRPHEVRQGAQNTCPMASSENRLYTRSPQDAVGVLARVAKGKNVIPEQKNPVAKCFLVPDYEANQSRKVPTDGNRLFASQVF